MYALLVLWLVSCGTDSDDGLTEDERRSKEIWTIMSINSGLWDTYTPVPEDFTVFSDSALVQEFLDLNGLSPTLTVRDVARPEKGGTRFKSIRIDLRSINNIRDTVILPKSWALLVLSEFNMFGGKVKHVSGLEHLQTVQDLSITGTSINEVPEEIVHLDLAWLALFSNSIVELPAWLIEYADTNRTVLWIGYNLIQEMPDNLLQKHWRIEVQGNQMCATDAADSATIFELSKSGAGGYILQGEYLSEPALQFHQQQCE